MIAVAVIVFVLALVTLRSWQLRRRRRLGYLIQNTWEFRLRNQIRRCFGEHTAAALAEPLLYCRCTGNCTGICWETLMSSCGLHCVVTNGDGSLNQAHCWLLPLQYASHAQRRLEVYVSITAQLCNLLHACNSVVSVTALLVQACNL